jgi:hypothetical protein
MTVRPFLREGNAGRKSGAGGKDYGQKRGTEVAGREESAMALWSKLHLGTPSRSTRQ